MARSPAYPGIDLAEAIEHARVIHDKERLNATPVDVVKEHLGYKPKSGSGNIVVSALAKFGLVEAEGTGTERTLRLTTSTQEILLLPEGDPERQRLIREAALRPKIHRLLVDEYGNDLPSDENLKRTLRTRYSFTPSGADDFVDEFRSTLSFAGLLDSDAVSESSDTDMVTTAASTTESRLPTSRKGFEIAISSTSSLVFTGDFPLTKKQHEKMLKLLELYEEDIVASDMADAVAEPEDSD